MNQLDLHKNTWRTEFCFHRTFLKDIFSDQLCKLNGYLIKRFSLETLGVRCVLQKDPKICFSREKITNTSGFEMDTLNIINNWDLLLPSLFLFQFDVTNEKYQTISVGRDHSIKLVTPSCHYTNTRVRLKSI